MTARKLHPNPLSQELDDAPVAVVIERARAAEPNRVGHSLGAETDLSDADLERWRAELLDPVGWAEILLHYGRASSLAIALTDVDGKLLGPCHNPQPVWNLLRRSATAPRPEPVPRSAPLCPFCLVPDQPCNAIAAAWEAGAAVFVNDPAGLAHMAIPLFLGRQRLGVLIAGQTFAQYPQRWALRSLARQLGVSQDDLWHAALHQVPISRATLRRYADLLASLGQAFLRQRYAAILDRDLHETSQRYRFMIDGSRDHGLLTVDETGRITSWNPGAAHLLGYAESEIVGQHYSCLFTPEDIAAQTHQNQIHLLDQVGRIQRESWWVRRDGTRLLAETVNARLGEKGGVPEYGILLRDVTEARRTAEAILQAQKLESIGVLAGGIAHDFNNLLTGILGNVSLALDGLPAGHVLRPLLDIAEKSSQKGAALIAQLLSYVGKGRILISRFDLSALIAEIVPMIETSIPKKVRLTLALNSGRTWIEADSSAIQQIVMNLIINGAEAIGPAGGGVIVSTGVTCLNSSPGGDTVPPSEPDAVFIEVRDSGCGMDEATKSRIFDPFFSTKLTGRGLGLAAVSGIVRDLKGKLDVFTAPGEGSTFRIVFPAVPPPRTFTPMPLSLPTESPGNGVILLADDDPVVRELACTLLERDGYSVLPAANGQEAVDLFRRHHDSIGAVLMDLTMPVMSGAEALSLITQIRADIPVIISSGYGETAVRQQFNGALVWVVRKPYTISELREKIAAAFAPRP